jgi:hypothetical protein
MGQLFNILDTMHQEHSITSIVFGGGSTGIQTLGLALV